MERKKVYILISAYSLVLLGLFSVTACVLIGSLSRAKSSVGTVDTEYIYVYATENESSEGAQSEADIWIARKHGEIIGIFSLDGDLIEVIDTYVKTLPEADKRLLGEGFEIVGKKQLNSIIEDYTE